MSKQKHVIQVNIHNAANFYLRGSKDDMRFKKSYGLPFKNQCTLNLGIDDRQLVGPYVTLPCVETGKKVKLPDFH